MSTRAEILSEIAAQFPDNSAGAITPAKLRQVCDSLANSAAVLDTDASASGRAVLTGTPAEGRAALGAAASASVAGVCYVDTSSGNDSTGTPSTPSLPFATIQAAITAASVGDTIQIAAGTYAPFTVSKRLRIVGAGRLSTIVAYTNTANAVSFSANVTDAILEDFGIVGNRDTTTGAISGYGSTQGIGIYFAAGNHNDRTLIRSVGITNPCGHAIFADGAAAGDYCEVSECRLNSVATTAPTWSTDHWVPGYTVTSTDKEVRYAILLLGGVTGWRIQRNRIVGYSQAIGLWYGANNCSVMDNFLVDNWGLMGATGATIRSTCEDYGSNYPTRTDNTWSGNTIKGSTSSGFEIAQGTCGCKVLGNTISGCGDAGVLVAGQNDATTSNTRDVLVANNIFDGLGSPLRAVLLTGYISSISVTNNIFTNIGTGNTAAIYVQSLGSGIAVSGNSFNKVVASRIIFLSGCSDGVRVAGNTFTGCTGQLIYVDATHHHSLVGNTAIGCTGQFGFNIVAATGITITGNNLDLLDQQPIKIQSGSSGCLVSDNNLRWDATNGYVQGVIEVSSSNDNLVERNTIRTASGIHQNYAIILSGTALRNSVTRNWHYNSSTVPALSGNTTTGNWAEGQIS